MGTKIKRYLVIIAVYYLMSSFIYTNKTYGVNISSENIVSTTNNLNSYLFNEKRGKKMLYKDIYFDINSGYRLSLGKLTWTTTSTNPVLGKVKSEMDIPIDVGLFTIYGNMHYKKRLFIDLSFGTGELFVNSATDTDTFTDLSTLPSQSSKANTDGDSKYIITNIGYSIINNNQHYFDIFVGYHKYNHNTKLKDLRTTIIFNPSKRQGEAANIMTPGLNSKYAIEYKGIGIGIRGGISLLSIWSWILKTNGTFTYLPYIDISGEGNWNLRDITISQRGHGKGLLGEVSISGELNNFYIETGAVYQLHTLSSGKFKNTDPTGSNNGELIKADTSELGPFLTVGLQF